MKDLANFRREYLKGGLRREDLTPDPMDFFHHWMEQAISAELLDPTAMCVATVDKTGQPWQRMVLLKQYNNQGFVFFTNLASRKALHLADNNCISLHFPWHMLERQVAITGKAKQLSTTEVVKYFITRPRESQLAAWASKQSSRLTARQVLEAKFAEIKAKFSNGEVPLPKFWGGYRIVPETMEFWQGGQHRLHDRFLYTKNTNGWQIDRLAP